MKIQMKKYLIKILWSMVVLISISACSSSDDVSDDGRFPSDEDIEKRKYRVGHIQRGSTAAHEWLPDGGIV